MPSSGKSHVCSSGSGNVSNSVSNATQSSRLDAMNLDNLGKDVYSDRPTQCTGWETAQCIADIESADFVSLRFDTSSNIPTSLHVPNNKTIPDDYYRSCLQSLDSNLPVRIGLCCGQWEPIAATWELRPHELGLWPGDMVAISEDIKASRFRSAANLSKDSQDGKQESNMVVSKWASQIASSTKWVVSALREVGVPVIVHNGLADVMQLCDKFVGPVPDNLIELGRVLEKVHPVIFDTSVLEQEGRRHAVGKSFLAPPASLEEVHRTMLERLERCCCQEGQVQIKQYGLFTYRFSSQRRVFGRCQGAIARDAMCIAESFLFDMDRRFRSEPSAQFKLGQKRPRMDTIELEAGSARKSARKSNAGAPAPRGEKHERDAMKDGKQYSIQGPFCPSMLNSHVACCRFQNRLAADGTGPYLYLRPQPLNQCTNIAANLHSLLHQLGATLDGHGKPVVTRAMAKQLRRALAQMKEQAFLGGNN